MHLQPPEHPSTDPRQHEEQPHQHDSHWDCGGGLPQHARVHPLQRPHVPPRFRVQRPGGNGEESPLICFTLYELCMTRYGNLILKFATPQYTK